MSEKMEPTLHERITALRAEGKSQQVIADALGISQAYVCFMLKGMGLPGRIGLEKKKSKATPELLEQIRADYKEMGYKALATKYGISVGTAYNWVNGLKCS